MISHTRPLFLCTITIYPHYQIKSTSFPCYKTYPGWCLDQVNITRLSVSNSGAYRVKTKWGSHLTEYWVIQHCTFTQALFQLIWIKHSATTGITRMTQYYWIKSTTMLTQGGQHPVHTNTWIHTQAKTLIHKFLPHLTLSLTFIWTVNRINNCLSQ